MFRTGSRSGPRFSAETVIRFVLCSAAAFAALTPAQSWALEPPIKPSPEALQRLDKEREPAYRATKLTHRLIQESLAASRRGDEKRVQAIKKQIKKIDKNGWAEAKLTEVLNEIRRLYRIEPSPGALYDGKPYEWRTEYSTLFAMVSAARRRPDGKRVAARTSGEDGGTVFIDPEVFASLPRVADFLIHEAIHFEQFTTGGFSTNTVVDQQEVEAYAAQLKYGPEGMFSEETSEFRDNAESLAAAMGVESDKAFWQRMRSSYYRSDGPRRDRPIRHRDEMIRLVYEWSDFESKSMLMGKPEYWGRYLRNERSWRFLRGTVARLCTAPSSDSKGVWTLKNYAVERPFAAIMYTNEISEFSDCEYDALADFLIAPDPVRYEDLVGFARAYRMRHGPWKARLAAVGDEFRARVTTAMSNVFPAKAESGLEHPIPIVSTR